VPLVSIVTNVTKFAGDKDKNINWMAFFESVDFLIDQWMRSTPGDKEKQKVIDKLVKHLAEIVAKDEIKQLDQAGKALISCMVPMMAAKLFSNTFVELFEKISQQLFHMPHSFPLTDIPTYLQSLADTLGVQVQSYLPKSKLDFKFISLIPLNKGEPVTKPAILVLTGRKELPEWKKELNEAFNLFYDIDIQKQIMPTPVLLASLHAIEQEKQSAKKILEKNHPDEIKVLSLVMAEICQKLKLLPAEHPFRNAADRYKDALVRAHHESLSEFRIKTAREFYGMDYVGVMPSLKSLIGILKEAKYFRNILKNKKVKERPERFCNDTITTEDYLDIAVEISKNIPSPQQCVVVDPQKMGFLKPHSSSEVVADATTGPQFSPAFFKECAQKFDSDLIKWVREWKKKSQVVFAALIILQVKLTSLGAKLPEHAIIEFKEDCQILLRNLHRVNLDNFYERNIGPILKLISDNYNPHGGSLSPVLDALRDVIQDLVDLMNQYSMFESKSLFVALSPKGP
jgi:hypothetical protein